MPTPPVLREERRSMTIQMPKSVVALIDRATSCVHKDCTAFIVEAAADRANEVLLDQTIFHLPAAGHDAFVAALDHPQEPNDCLKALAAKRPIWEK